MNTGKNNDVTINVNINGNSNQNGTAGSILPWSQTVNDRLLSKEELAMELEKGKLVNVSGTDGEPIHARLICTPAGSGKYYTDTRDASGNLEIGREIDYVS